MIRKLLGTCLVLAPLLLFAAEYVRLFATADSEGLSANLAAIADRPGMWEVFGWLTLALVLAWLGAVLGLTEAARDLSPGAATVGGVVAVTGAVAFAMHQSQFVELNAVLAGHDQYIRAATRVGIEGTGMEDATIVLQLVGLWAGPLVLGGALARAGALPWWRFACIPLWVVMFFFVGSNSPTFAAVHLLLIPPYATVARLLFRTESATRSGGGPSRDPRALAPTT